MACHSSFHPVERFVWGIVPINGQGYYNVKVETCHSSFHPVERFIWETVPINSQGYYNKMETYNYLLSVCRIWEIVPALSHQLTLSQTGWAIMSPNH